MIIFSIFVLFFSGCVGDSSLTVKQNQKAFDGEDRYIMFALRAEELKDYNTSAKLFNTLYERSHKKEYLYRSLRSELLLKDDDKVISKIDDVLDGKFDDFKLVRFKIVALMQSGKLELAKKDALKLVGLTKDTNDYLLMSEIYIKQNKFNTALKYLEGAYVKEYNEKLLDRLAIILYVNLERKKDAIAYLKTHIMVNGCSELICNRLISFYSNENDIDGLLSIYLKIYTQNHNKIIASKIIQIYNYQKEYIKLMDFLEDSKSDDHMLLKIYINLNDYKKAYPLARKLYKETNNIDYLGQSAIFEYENSENKNEKVMLNDVVSTLGDVVKKSDEPLYLNYLGYLLIEHDIDVKKGITYIDRALIANPLSIYYLDSKAWGYYKLGECKKADAIMKEMFNLENINEPEVLQHLEKIKKCVKLK